MLYEFYKANSVQVPKNNKYENYSRRQSISPAATLGGGGGNVDLSSSQPSALSSALASTSSSASISTITSSKIVNYSKLNMNDSNTTSTSSSSSLSTVASVKLSHPKNVNGDEMVPKDVISASSSIIKRLHAPFHPRIKYSSVNNKSSPIPVPVPVPIAISISSTISSNIPTTSVSVPVPTPPVVVPLSPVVPSSVIQAPILPPPPAAAAIAAAFFRDGYHNFHQQIRAQELLKQQQQQHQQQQQLQQNATQFQHQSPIASSLPTKTQIYMQNLMKGKDNRSSENDDSSSADENDDDGDDEDEGKYPEIDDIHLIEGSKSNFANQMSSSMDADYMSDESHKYSLMAAHALRNLEYSFSDYSGASPGEEALYQCRHCGKKYRWKSTLRRHENVECGGKEPSHQCPYCPYKSKQRGNLGVHVRKHHANLPQLASKRRSKYSQPRN